MLTHIDDWHALTPAHQHAHLQHIEAALITLQRQIPGYAAPLHTPTSARAWAALTDAQRFTRIIELEMQVGNHRDYLNELCRPAPAAGCAQRRSLEHAAAV